MPFTILNHKICKLIEVSLDAGDPCMVHQDCQGDDVECIGLTCRSNAVTANNNNESRRLSREIGIQTSIDVIETKDVSTSIDKSSIRIPQKATKVQGRLCNNFNFSVVSVNKFVNILVGDVCITENVPCDGFSHSICLQGACQCQKGYYLRNGLCKAGK